MHSLTAARRPRMSETAPQWFMFETSCYAFGGRNRRFAKLIMSKVDSNASLIIRLYLIIDNEFSQLMILISFNVRL